MLSPFSSIQHVSLCGDAKRRQCPRGWYLFWTTAETLSFNLFNLHNTIRGSLASLPHFPNEETEAGLDSTLGF